MIAKKTEENPDEKFKICIQVASSLRKYKIMTFFIRSLQNIVQKYSKFNTQTKA